MERETTTRTTRQPMNQKAPILLGLAGLLVASIWLALAGTGGAAARGTGQEPVKTLTVVAVTEPARFEGSNPFPTRPLRGQKLVAVTVAFDGDFKRRLRSSETGEVFLTGRSGEQRYYTVDTATEKSGGPGKKPSRLATFVFSVPEDAGPLVFHYGSTPQTSTPLR